MPEKKYKQHLPTRLLSNSKIAAAQEWVISRQIAKSSPCHTP